VIFSAASLFGDTLGISAFLAIVAMRSTVPDLRRPPLAERAAAVQRPPATPPARRPFRDNPRLILLGIGILLVALVAMVTFPERAPELNPNFLTEVVLYALSAADLTMLIALGFVLARNVIKLAVERRRGLPFSRFRANWLARCSASRSSRPCSSCWSAAS
jgi:hypothetical protein